MVSFLPNLDVLDDCLGRMTTSLLLLSKQAKR